MKPPATSRPRWRVLAVADDDPHVFANNLQRALQLGADEGWILATREYRGSACILTMYKVETGPHEAHLPPPPPRPLTVMPKADQYQEVLYYFQTGPDGVVAVEKFDSLLGALRLLQTHMQGEWPLPIKIVRCHLDVFEAKSIPALLKLYSRELQHGGHPN